MQVWEARREVYNIIFKRGFRFFLRRFSGKHPNADDEKYFFDKKPCRQADMR
jgi:hypothetical protein